ncbi:MAG: response regulator [Methylocystis sp.]|nr:MAG: response regulator [Methylocystis sp.]
MGHHILVVEDEAIIAMDLFLAVEDCGGVGLGPAATVSEALALLSGAASCDGAILDVNLPDGDIGRVLDELEMRNAAVVVHTGFALPPEVRLRHPHVEVFQKPTLSRVLANALAKKLDEAAR